MPIWKIAWRSIQRRSFASLLTTFSMALGVMLVVAVLLIVGIVDQSFNNNSSLGYDSIVGPKGGKLQLTLNTIYYLSQPVNNLPFEFYREFLPKSSREDLMAVAGKEYENKVQVKVDGKWQDLGESTQIAAGETEAVLRVPLLGAKLTSPKEFTLSAKVQSPNTVNTKVVSAVQIQLGTIRPIEEMVVPEENTEEGADEDAAEETAELAAQETTAQDRAQPELKIEPRYALAGDSHAYFDVSLTGPTETPVTYAVSLSDGADGKYLQYVEDSKTAVIPVCLGDYYGQYRVVGTTPEFFDLVYNREKNLSYEFADGTNFSPPGEEILYEAIIGAKVAREMGIKVGDGIEPSHGAPGGNKHDAFKVVGVLKSNGTPQDRAVFVNMDGFNDLEDHQRDDGKKEVTALLVDTKDAFRGIQLDYRLSDEPIGQVVKPVAIIYGLFSSIVDPIRNLLLIITALICVVSGISILVSIYNSMNDRKQEIAVMRSLGAGRSMVMSIVLIESVMISLAGCLVGWIAGHAIIGLASNKIEAETGVIVSAFDFAPPMEELSYLLGPTLTPKISVEFWLIPLITILAIVVGFMPALSAYRTDVAKALQSSP